MGPLLPEIANIPWWVILVLSVWSIIWKGLALWHAARLEQRNWFVTILVLNTVGILEIVYLFIFSKEKGSFIQKIFKRGE